MAPAREVRVPGDGIRLQARDHGGDGVPVVLLHGLASNARIWDGVAADLVAAGLRVVALDQRGHGGSEQPDAGYDFATICRDLAAALEALGIRRPVLAGHSWGAGVALAYAAGRPGDVAGLVLVDGGVTSIASLPGMTWEQAERQLAPPRFAVPLEDWLLGARRWLPAAVDSRASWVQGFLRAGVEVDAAGVARARLHFDNHMRILRALYDQRPDALFAQVRCPVLFCPAAGGKQPERKREGVERALAQLADGRVHWFADAGHDIPLERPVELAAAIAGFVADLGARRGR